MQFKNCNVVLDIDVVKKIKSDNLSELIRRLLNEYADKKQVDASAPDPSAHKSWEQYADEERKKLAFKEEQEVFILKRKNLEDKYETARTERAVIMDADPIRAKELAEEMRLIKKQIDDLDAGVRNG